jgi:hypothetical protein
LFLIRGGGWWWWWLGVRGGARRVSVVFNLHLQSIHTSFCTRDDGEAAGTTTDAPHDVPTTTTTDQEEKTSPHTTPRDPGRTTTKTLHSTSFGSSFLRLVGNVKIS